MILDYQRYQQEVAEETLVGSEPRALPLIAASIAQGQRAQVNAYFSRAITTRGCNEQLLAAK